MVCGVWYIVSMGDFFEANREILNLKVEPKEVGGGGQSRQPVADLENIYIDVSHSKPFTSQLAGDTSPSAKTFPNLKTLTVQSPASPARQPTSQLSPSLASPTPQPSPRPAPQTLPSPPLAKPKPKSKPRRKVVQIADVVEEPRQPDKLVSPTSSTPLVQEPQTLQVMPAMGDLLESPEFISKVHQRHNELLNSVQLKREVVPSDSTKAHIAAIVEAYPGGRLVSTIRRKKHTVLFIQVPDESKRMAGVELAYKMAAITSASRRFNPVGDAESKGEVAEVLGIARKLLPK